MNDKNKNEQYMSQLHDEDEMDLRELFKTILAHRWFIAIFTSIVTILALVYVFVKTPIYEVKSNVRIGYIGNKVMKNSNITVNKLIEDPNTMVNTLKIIFHVGEKSSEKKKFISKVVEITTNRKVRNFITIKTEGISNDEALKKNEEVVSYLQKYYQPRIDQYIFNKKNQIKNAEEKIFTIDHFDKKNIENQIKILKDQKIVNINKQINFLEKVKIPILKKKISFYTNKLKTFAKNIDKLSQIAQSGMNNQMLAIISIQMVNYQNLILNAQNEIANLNMQIQNTIMNTIPILKNKEDDILKVDIVNLKHKNVTLKNQKLKLENDIKKYKFEISKQNIRNSYVIGGYIIHDYPAKPKKKLIVTIAFITGLILSIFLVFFIDFMKNIKEE